MTNLKELRLKHNLTQQEVADLLGISKQGYSSKEKNLRKFTIPQAVLLSEFYGVPIHSVENFLYISTHDEYPKQTA